MPWALDPIHVVITEKIHGFNARLGRTQDGVAWVGSRNQVVDPEKDRLQGFVPWALSVIEHVPPGYTVYGEWAGKGIQKGLDYGAPRFFAFGLRYLGEPVQPLIDTIATLIPCDIAPVLYEGPLPSVEVLDALRRGRSLLAEQDREGIVINPVPAIFDQWGHQVIGKFKAPAFEERAHARREQPTPASLADVEAFVDEYATDERLSHVLAQLDEAGIDGMDRTNTGALLRAYYADVVREGAHHHDQLTESDQKMVGKVLNGRVKALVDARRLAVLA